MWPLDVAPARVLVHGEHETESDDADKRAAENEMPVAAGFLQDLSEHCHRRCRRIHTETMKPPMAAVNTTARVIGMRSIPDWMGSWPLTAWKY